MSILLALAAVAADGRPFELYQPIIDRCPFGDPPDDPTVPPDQAAKASGKTPAEVEEAALSQQQAELQQAVGVSVMNIAPDGGVWVGFSIAGDQKSMKHHYVAVGEERDGWLVKEADPSKGTVTFVKDSVEVPRKVGDTIAKSGGRGGGGRQPPQRNGFGGRSPLIAGKPQQTDAGAPSTSMKSHRQMRREQDEAERKARLEQAEALKKMQEEETRRREEEKAERDAQREADKEEMQRKLMDMQEQLKRDRETRRQREAEGGGDSQDPGVQ